jgi:hypothetical protein
MVDSGFLAHVFAGIDKNTEQLKAIGTTSEPCRSVFFLPGLAK